MKNIKTTKIIKLRKISNLSVLFNQWQSYTKRYPKLIFDGGSEISLMPGSCFSFAGELSKVKIIPYGKTLNITYKQRK